MLPGLQHGLLPERGDLFDPDVTLPGFHGEVNLEGVLQRLPPLRHELLPQHLHGLLDVVLGWRESAGHSQKDLSPPPREPGAANLAAFTQCFSRKP